MIALIVNLHLSVCMVQVPMHGAVNLAVETCGETFHRFWTYLNFSSPLLSPGPYDRQDCAWAFGMNLFDLTAWRKGDYTNIYHQWQHQVSHLQILDGLFVPDGGGISCCKNSLCRSVYLSKATIMRGVLL